MSIRHLILTLSFLLTAGCAPNLSEVFEKGWKCKVEITVPEGAREGEVIAVDADIYHCVERIQGVTMMTDGFEF